MFTNDVWEPNSPSRHALTMTSQPVALLLATLGVVPPHSRPQVSNDNPYSEAQFKTLKYRPDFPDRFGGYEDAEAFCPRFFPWYNTAHHHGALGLMTPHDIHPGLAAAKWEHRAAVLRAAYAAHPALPARSTSPAAPADGGVDQQAPSVGSPRAPGSRLMTAAHKFPTRTVSFDLTTSGPRRSPSPSLNRVGKVLTLRQ
jgi:hypothetical protein